MRRGGENKKDENLPVKQYLGIPKLGREGREWLRVIDGRLERFVVGWDGLGGLRVGKEGLRLVGMV